MKETLERYIDVENIPKKYGGKLDFEFGDMPMLEPSIVSRLNFQNPSVQKGANTIPTGPIKWEEALDGSVQAVAVGSEGGKPRRQVVASLSSNTSLKAMHASSIAGTTPLVEKADPLTTTGTHTQPSAEETAAAANSSPAPSEKSDNPTTTTLPDRTKTNGDDATRTGTSETRMADQQGTHAHNQLAEGTPHDAVNDHGHGDKTVTMEPGTVGQAAKDVSQPLPSANHGEEQQQQPGYVDQAKDVAAAAAGKVSEAASAAVGAVTGTGEKESKEEAKEEKKQDERVGSMDGTQVEEYLRGKNFSGAAPAV